MLPEQPETGRKLDGSPEHGARMRLLSLCGARGNLDSLSEQSSSALVAERPPSSFYSRLPAGEEVPCASGLLRCFAAGLDAEL